MNNGMDMSQFVEAKSDQLNADDLIGAPRTVTVLKVEGSDGEQPVSIYYEGGGNKPFKPCKTMRRVLLGVWGRYASEYIGRRMTLYRDDSVTFGGLQVGGIRISHMSHISKETVVVVMKTKGKKAGIKILPLSDDAPRNAAPSPAGSVSEDRAAKWAADFTAEVTAAVDRVDLEMLVESKAKRLAEIKEKRPELHKSVAEAIDAKRAALTPADAPAPETDNEAPPADWAGDDADWANGEAE